MKTIYMPALGIACALGMNKQTVLAALLNPQVNHPTYPLISGKTVPVAQIPFDLSDLPAPFKALNSKNNRLLRVTLDEIAAEVAIAKQLYGATRIGIVMATSTSGMLEEEKSFAQHYHTGQCPADYSYDQLQLGSPSMFVQQYFELKGPAYTVSTACSSSGKALCAARRLIQADICDAVITGGVDTLCDLTLNGFDSLELLSESICNPFSKNRKGINIGEGAAVFLMTRDRLSDVAIEFLGGGETSDAYHISSPDPSGVSALAAMKEALEMAHLRAEDIAYINLHGTGTQLNDAMESRCIHELFGESVFCSSTKALTGHALGAAGAIEAAFLWLVLSQERDGTVPLPPHHWDGEWDSQLPLIKLVGRNERVPAINNRLTLMSNSFAFGGSNVSVVFSKKIYNNAKK